MSFDKVGTVFPIVQTKVTNNEQWKAFKKKANITAVVDDSIKIEAAENKTADFQVVADINPDKFIYIHTTIMAGVKTADNGYWITPETEKFINDNHDSWKCADLLKDYHTFRTATTFVEHDQNIERAKGKCIDAIARKLPDTILIDVLFSVDKRHDDLVNNIMSGIINAVSMGCTTEKTVCSICGNEAADSDKYCEHIRNGKGQTYTCADGVRRKAAEICINNTFFDCSLVANPAFAGAIFRKILSSSQASNHLLANILTSKIESMTNNDVFLKAASKETEMIIKNDGTLNVKEADKEIKGNLNQQDLEQIKSIISSTIQEEKAATTFLSKIVNKFFGKTSTHPIENESANADFSIDRENYDSIANEYKKPYDIQKDFNEQDEKHQKDTDTVTKLVKDDKKKKASRVDNFVCYKCKHETDLWKVKAASIDLGHSSILSCPKCAFIMEAEVYPIIKNAMATEVDRERLKEDDLGYTDNEIDKMTDEDIELVLTNNQKAESRRKDNNSFLRSSSMFVVKHEIPTKKQGNKYFFDKDGDSFIAKGEKLHLVAAKKNVGMFKTEANEFVYLPVKQAAGNPAQKLHEIIKAAQDLLSVISKNPPAATTAPTAARKEALLSTQGPSHSGQYGGNFGVSQKAPAKAAPAKTTNIEGKLEEILSVINGLKAEFASTTQVAQPVR